MRAVIVVDIQNDFLETGALPVPGANQTYCNRVASFIGAAKVPIFFSRESHPINHSSFLENGGEWPPHCVENTDGEKIVERLMESALVNSKTSTVVKGTQVDNHPYSAFGNEDEDTGLFDMLRGFDEVDVIGLATDYCVKETALSAVKLGFETTVLLDYCRGITEETTKEAVDEMTKAGVSVIRKRS